MKRNVLRGTPTITPRRELPAGCQRCCSVLNISTVECTLSGNSRSPGASCRVKASDTTVFTFYLQHESTGTLDIFHRVPGDSAESNRGLPQTVAEEVVHLEDAQEDIPEFFSQCVSHDDDIVRLNDHAF